MRDITHVLELEISANSELFINWFL